MTHFKILFFSILLLSGCNIYNSELEIIAIPPSYERKDHWHGDTMHYSHTDFYVLKNFKINDSLDLLKVDSFVLKNYPILKKNNWFYYMTFYKYTDEMNVNTKQYLGTDRSILLDGDGKIILLIYEWRCGDGFLGVTRYNENGEVIGVLYEKRPLLNKK